MNTAVFAQKSHKIIKNVIDTSDTIGIQKTAVILLNTAGTPTENLPSANDIQQAMFDGEYSANAYFRAMSFNKLQFQGRIFGWYERPDLRLNCVLPPEQLFEEIDIGVELKSYDRFVVFYNLDEKNCEAASLGQSTHGKIEVTTSKGVIRASVSHVAVNHRLSKPTLPFQNLSGVASGVLTHELGHALGILGHSNILHCGNKTFSDVQADCTQSAIADLFTIMGGEGFFRAGASMNACHRQDLGWFDREDLLLQTTAQLKSKAVEFDLFPISNKSSEGPIAVRIDLEQPIPVTTNVFVSSLFLEYKTPQEFDRRLADLQSRATEIYKNLTFVSPQNLELSFLNSRQINIDGLQIRGGFFRDDRCITTYLFDTKPGSLAWGTQRYDLYDALDAFLNAGESVTEPRNKLKIEVLKKNVNGSLRVRLSAG